MRLIAVYGPLRGSVFTVDTELVLGRGTGNDIDLEDDLVSRRHCSLKAEDRGIVLRDLGSRNGTLLNDAPVSEAVLEHGDRITAGGVTSGIDLGLWLVERFAGQEMAAQIAENLEYRAAHHAC